MDNRARSREEDWFELLSAYHDGELEPERREFVETKLRDDPRCALQLEELRSLSHMLPTWKAPLPAQRAPHPQPQRGVAVPLRWAAAAIFILGLSSGVLGNQMVRALWQGSNQTAPRVAAQPPQSPVSNAAVDIDPLLDEIRAGELRASLALAIERAAYSEALSLMNTIIKEYPETLVAKELRQSPQMLRMAKYATLL